ncbi:hypothetical protein FUAX_30140 [Fulvitalea axinellae]|uniref:DUF1684 domain-containing protein n=1 Tax=Fulvitalea axinellae TaxID=1182444 RepID=A0AAU9CYN8_9BACT|nr:hypothetical protein FUAX_30140 [Fulvitalea axinellae]
MKIKNLILTTALLLAGLVSKAQDTAKEKEIAEIKAYQQAWNRTYADPKKSPLAVKDRESFKGLAFFPINLEYRLQAKLVKDEQYKRLRVRTSDGKVREYVRFGKLYFTLDGKSLTLEAYQPADFRKRTSSLFVPFTDKTNGDTSYGGGRYLDLEIPEHGGSLILDFNKAYNPYCAYNNRYSCPVPPKANRLPVAIPAGMAAPDDH